MKNIFDFIEKILVGDEVDITKFPEELHNVKTERIADSNINVFLERTLELQKQKHIMIATNSIAVKNLVSALNMNFKQNKISVIYEYETDTSELEAELENLLLHTQNGETYFPEESKLKNIYHSNDRILVKGMSINKGTELFSASKQPWGTLLSEEYHFSHICGTVLSQIDKMSMKEKSELMLKLMEKNSDKICSISDIIILSDDNKKKRFVFLSGIFENSTPAETEVQLFTGLSIENDDTGLIVERIAEFPSVLIEDINAVIMNRKYNTMQLPTNEIIRNTMQRICFMN